MSQPPATPSSTGAPSRAELLAIRSELGELKTEAKPFTLQERIKVTRIHCSAAAGGSGDFHSLRKARTTEEQRLAAMDAEWDEKVRALEYNKRREARLREEEEERNVKRSKRAARKERQQQAKEQAKGAALLPSIANDGSFMEVMEAKEKLKKLLAAVAARAAAPASSATDDASTGVAAEAAAQSSDKPATDEARDDKTPGKKTSDEDGGAESTDIDVCSKEENPSSGTPATAEKEEK